MSDPLFGLERLNQMKEADAEQAAFAAKQAALQAQMAQLRSEHDELMADFTAKGRPDPELYTPAGLRKFGVR